MESAGYTTLTRQTGLLHELQIVANNIANSATTGYRQEGLIFGEYVKRTGDGPSISMATANIRNTSMAQGGLTRTGSKLDFAIEGDGFFLIETPAGERLTRAGRFALSPQGVIWSRLTGFACLMPGAPRYSYRPMPPTCRSRRMARSAPMAARWPRWGWCSPSTRST